MKRTLIGLLIFAIANAQYYYYLDDKCQLQWYKSEGSSYFTIRLNIPNHYYVAFSYGGTHLNSDMIVFKADSTSSAFYDMYSYGYNEPTNDVTNNYSGSSSYTQSTNTVTFQFTRLLNTYDPLDFVMTAD